MLPKCESFGSRESLWSFAIRPSSSLDTVRWNLSEASWSRSITCTFADEAQPSSYLRMVQLGDEGAVSPVFTLAVGWFAQHTH